MSRRRYMVFFTCLVILNLILPVQNAASADSKDRQFQSLQKMLINDGLDKAWIKKLYSKPEVYFDAGGVSLFFMHREAGLNYDQFAAGKSIQKAGNYMRKHKIELARVEKKYGVDRKIITAIMLVETRLGTVMGRRSILNSLSTMASLSDSGVRDMLWGEISGSSRLRREKFVRWSEKKSKWAYAELKAFLKYATREKIDPVYVHGSYAGAMGIAQFMPSCVLAFARDGDMDGRIDLFNHADAIASIASYLKHYGWHPGIDRKMACKVIHHYNHSNYYVDAILKISELLKD